MEQTNNSTIDFSKINLDTYIDSLKLQLEIANKLDHIDMVLSISKKVIEVINYMEMNKSES